MYNLVGYARVSSVDQKENTSLPQQKREIERFCEQNGYNLIAFYQDTESGATIDGRENFQWALKTVYNAADGLVVYRLDRFSRRVLDAERLKYEFQEYGKKLFSVMDTCNMDSEDGEFIYTINSAIAELERKRIKARVQAGKDRKKESGGWCGGRVPYGYAALNKTLVELPYEQKVIKYIKRLYYLEFYNYTQIARKLDSLSIPSKSRRNWNGNTVARIINRESESVVALRENGKLLTARHWEDMQGREKGSQEATEIPGPIDSLKLVGLED